MWMSHRYLGRLPARERPSLFIHRDTVARMVFLTDIRRDTASCLWTEYNRVSLERETTSKRMRNVPCSSPMDSPPIMVTILDTYYNENSNAHQIISCVISFRQTRLITRRSKLWYIAISRTITCDSRISRNYQSCNCVTIMRVGS